jgi:hypothetical protein
MTNKLKLVFLFLLTTCSFYGQETKIRGFVNTDFGYQEQGKNAFGVGKYDNFITSNINDRISFLGETVFEYESGEGYIVDIERVVIKYEFDNRFDIKVGKFLNPIGYWNNAYHHGTLLQPTIRRPLAVRFEDEAGILPVSSVGIWIGGHDIGKLKFGYDLAISNGIGPNSFVTDDNNIKAITGGVHIKPLDKLEIGISGYTDRLLQNEKNIAGNPIPAQLSMAHGAFHIAYLGSKFELIAENHYIYHTYGLPTKVNSFTNALFAYFGYRINNKFTPYLVYDNLAFDNKDYYFETHSTQKYTVGMRYAFNYLSNIKLELCRQEFSVGKVVHAANLSFAIGF